jgi:hypothetical protein
MNIARSWTTRMGVASAAAGILAVTVAASPAAAVDEWASGYTPRSHSYNPSSSVDGALVQAQITWDDHGRHSFWARVSDTARDGRGAVAQIRYRVLINNKWYTHYRYFGKTTTGKGTSRDVDATGRYPMGDLHIRACTVRTGTKPICDGAFR